MLKILKACLIVFVATLFVCGLPDRAVAQGRNVHYGWQRTIKLENLSIRVFLAGQDTGAVNYLATLFVGKISKGKDIKLTKLKFVLTDAATGDSARVFGPVKFSGEVCDKCPHEKDTPAAGKTSEAISANELADGRAIDLKRGNAYAFAYAFKGLNEKGFPAKLTVSVQFELTCDGKTTIVLKRFDCQRKRRTDFVNL